MAIFVSADNEPRSADLTTPAQSPIPPLEGPGLQESPRSPQPLSDDEVLQLSKPGPFVPKSQGLLLLQLSKPGPFIPRSGEPESGHTSVHQEPNDSGSGGGDHHNSKQRGSSGGVSGSGRPSSGGGTSGGSSGGRIAAALHHSQPLSPTSNVSLISSLLSSFCSGLNGGYCSNLLDVLIEMQPGEGGRYEEGSDYARDRRSCIVQSSRN